MAEQAVQWLLELQETAWAQSTLAQVQRWRDASPEHERAWQHIDAVNRRIQGLRTAGGDSGHPVEPARHALLTPAKGASRRRSIRRLLALLVTAGGASMAWQSQPMRQWSATLRTARGERLRRTLEDGTVIDLAGGSALNLDFNATIRRVILIAGEIFVTTATPPGEHRPFIVDTRLGEVQAIGTKYSVRILESPRAAVLAAVFEGAIRLTPTRASAGPVQLQAGMQMLLTPEGLSAPQPADPNRSAWASGSLVAKNLRLDAFLAELSFHAPFALECAPDVAGRRLSGSYPIKDIPKVVGSIAQLLDLRVETRNHLLTGKQVRLVAADARS